MKVDRIEVFPVSVPYRNVEKNSSGVSRFGVSDVIVKVTTDDGCVGWGESTRTSSAEVIIKTLQAMVPVLLNQDPWQNQHHERNVYLHEQMPYFAKYILHLSLHKQCNLLDLLHLQIK